MMMFAILFGLSMDYEVFLLSPGPGGVRAHRRQPQRASSTVWPHRAGDHVGRPDHDQRVRRVRADAGRRDQDVRPRPGGRRVRRRDGRAHGARAGDDGAAGRRQLVAAAAGSTACCPTSTSRARRSRPAPALAATDHERSTSPSSNSSGPTRWTSVWRHLGTRPALVLGVSAAVEDAADVAGLAGVLDVVVGDADQAHAERHRRIPARVDDAVEVLGCDASEQVAGAAARPPRSTRSAPRRSSGRMLRHLFARSGRSRCSSGSAATPNRPVASRR